MSFRMYLVGWLSTRIRVSRSLASSFVLLGVLPAQALVGTAYQMQLGNPGNATADTNNHDHYLIQRPVQALDYNDARGQPNWASWDLSAADLGPVTRSTLFFVDTNLPANFYHVGIGEYSGSGYDRGHLCPSADRTDTTNDNQMVFYMSNMMPQTGDNNSGTWNNFEGYCRGLVQSTNDYELLITCGPSGFAGARLNTNGYVAIPDYTWKIVVVVPPGAGFATNRITTTNRVIAIKVPNTNGVSSVWQNFITSASQIQVDTGLTFFTDLPPEVAAALRAKVDGQTNPPPAIFAFTPTNGAASNSVVLTGTNFTTATAVAFNDANAMFSVDSATQITAIVPTNAGSGFLSVTTPNGTAISTNPFTVLNNGGAVYSGMLAGWDVSGVTNFGLSPLDATTNAGHLAVVGLTRASGVRTSGSGVTGGWGGTGFTNVTASAAVASNLFVTFSVTANNGYKFSCTSLSRFDYYRSPTGPTSGVLQFQVGAANFTDLTNLYYPTLSAGASIGAIDLSGVTALQNVGAGTNVTFRVVNFGGTSASGTWYVYNTLGTTAPDLALQGTATQVLTTNAPALPPALSAVVCTNHQFQFTVTGSPGTNYIVQTATNLAAPVWLSVATNVAPFSFTHLNIGQSPQSYYRALVAP